MERERSAAAWLAARLAAGPPLLLDGALGTELERRGVDCTLPLWSAHALLGAPDLVRAIHREYAAAGAEVLTANTFRTQRRTLRHAGLGPRAAELTTRAVSLAREAADAAARAGAPRRILVAGSVAPLEDCWHPERVPDDEALAREHAEHARHLAAAGADLLLVETMNTAREAAAAARAARATGLPTWVGFTCAPGARLLSGESLADALAALRPIAPQAVLVNCLAVADVPACLPVLAASGLPFGASPNLGPARGAPDRAGSEGPDAGGEAAGGAGPACGAEASPERFAEAVAAWRAAGARILGGCCGTGPAHVRALARRLAA